jgi:hypothetical protein
VLCGRRRGWHETWGGDLIFLHPFSATHPRTNVMTLFSIDNGRHFEGGLNGPRLHIVSPVTAAAAGVKRLAFSGWFKSRAPIPPNVKQRNIANARKTLADGTLVITSDGKSEPLGGHDGNKASTGVSFIV